MDPSLPSPTPSSPCCCWPFLRPISRRLFAFWGRAAETKHQGIQTERIIMMDEDEMQAFCSNIAKISGDWYRLYKAAPPQEEEGPCKQP